MKGQEHIVRSLQTAIQTGREGQAYLFSGPRGTGKTSTARILAKALNCEHLVEGEPCCECDSCKAVEAGTSYDVHELDAASNNGVDAMRDLIERSMLGTPGRHKVYILDEVHMLSKGAEAALLKTLEEPPPHVVFVLATTDPQKVSETIRSRCQPLSFHLLPMDVMESHVRWLIGDAGLAVQEDAIEAVLRQGGGSARDTLSALELIATSGGTAPDVTPLDEFVEALIEHDPARALTAVATSVNRGRDPRTLADELVGHLRNCFLSLMAPELVVLPDRRAVEVGALAQRLGAAGSVRAIETIGSTLVEMRHAPDPRVLLEVALVKLTSAAADAGVGALIARIERLEQQVANGATGGGGTPPPAAGRGPGGPPVVRPPSGDRGAQAAPSAGSEPGGRPVLGGRLGGRGPGAPGATPAPASSSTGALPPRGDRPAGPPAAAAAAAPAADSAASAPPRPAGGALDATMLTKTWTDAVLPKLRPLAKALFADARLELDATGVVRATIPAALKQRAEEHRAAVEAALSTELGSSVTLSITGGVGATETAGPGSSGANRRDLPPEPEPEHENDIDLNELTDAPAVPRMSGIERVTAAFPGAQLIDEER